MRNLKYAFIPVCLLLITLFIFGCENGPEETAPPPQTSAPVTETEATETEPELIRVFNKLYPADTAEIVLSSAEITSFDGLLSALKQFSGLSVIDLTDHELTVEEKQRLKDAFPGAEIKCRAYAVLQDKKIYADETEIDLSGDLNVSELKAVLSYLPDVKTVRSDSVIPLDDKEDLIRSFPGVSFDVTGECEIYGIKVTDKTEEIDLKGKEVDVNQLITYLKRLPAIKKADLHGQGFNPVEQTALAEEFPDVHFLWEVTILGKKYDSETEDLDLSDKKELTADMMRQAIPLMKGLKRVDMSDCGSTNEELAALREEFPGVKIVWRIHMLRWSTKTDAIAFSDLIRDYDYQRLTDEDIQCLKYCTDLQALDLGHQAITDISVICDYLPELRILILADNKIKDLSPVTKLKHLHYIELFVNPNLKDVSPLGECKELVDVNISYLDINDISALLDLPLVERFWIEHTHVPENQINQLRERHPDATVISVGSGSVDQGWRTHPRYYAMKDMYNKQYYMSEEFSKYDGK